METMATISLNYSQLLSAVRQMPYEERLRFSKDILAPKRTSGLRKLVRNIPESEIDNATLLAECKSTRHTVLEK